MASQSGGTESGDLFYCLIFWIFLLGFVIRCIFPFFKHFRLRKRSECWNVLFHHFFQFFWRSLWTFNEIQKFHDFITSITRIDFWSNFFFFWKVENNDVKNGNKIWIGILKSGKSGLKQSFVYILRDILWKIAVTFLGHFNAFVNLLCTFLISNGDFDLENSKHKFRIICF